VGPRDIKPKGKKVPRIFWRIYFKVGDLVTYDQMTATGRRERTEEMERVGMDRVYALRDELRQEHPGKH
jgi:hypothetical protein